MDYKFEDKGKFALLTFNKVYVDLPPTTLQLSDGTRIMPGVPVPDLGIWKEWIGSIRIERLQDANLVLFVEEASYNPEILDDVHQRLGDNLSRLFTMVHLRSGIECESADLLCGSSKQGVPSIRRMGKLSTFYRSKGYRRAPITKEWLEDATALRNGLRAMESSKSEFQRVLRGFKILSNDLQQQTGEERLHQFVRALEALILPDIGRTQTQFAHRCQTFARASGQTSDLLLEVFAMRSNAEHVHPWDTAVQQYPADQREDVCWQRTRQIEHLACDAYSRLLRDVTLRPHFRTDATITDFWKMPDDQRRALWGNPLDIAAEPLIQEYDQWNRAVA